MSQEIFNQFKKDIVIKGFSQKTRESYLRCAKAFLNDFSDSKKYSAEGIKDYLFFLINEKKFANATIRIYFSAIKFLFTVTLQKPWELNHIPQIKQTKRLPSFFTFREIEKLFNAADHIKHKALLMTIYASGLRVSECQKLKVTDILRDNMKLKISQAKGFKDRYTILSKTCLKYLEKYWRACRPQNWLFPGYDKAKPMNIRSIQHAYYKAKNKAGINKQGGIHTQRHSFATHFLEAGGGIFQLQKLLGHKNLKTTLVYIHLQEENIITQSPLDILGHDHY